MAGEGLTREAVWENNIRTGPTSQTCRSGMEESLGEGGLVRGQVSEKEAGGSRIIVGRRIAAQKDSREGRSYIRNAIGQDPC